MAQGGTIPTNRTQSVTFFNTTGIIEKEKGIYLSPRFKGRLSDVGKEVRTVFLNVLNSEAVTDPDYTNIDISSWSPQDRSLTVRGNIDDFRLVTDVGDCLNYLVVTRNVTNGNTTYTYYYGFFITDVQQAGGSSIRLTLEADDFTNIFYLHNRHVLTSLEVSSSDYDPFNERMKNCHVNRQHYNRVRITEKQYVLKVWLTQVQSGLYLQDGEPIRILFTDDHGGTEVEGTIKYFDDRDYQEYNELYIEILSDVEEDIGASENWSTIYYGGNQYQCDYDVNDIEWEELSSIVPDNLKIFLNQEESFKFKYQYRDLRCPFYLGRLFSESEIDFIKNQDNFLSLSNNLRKKILKACLQFLVIELKSTEKSGYYTTQDIEPTSLSIGYKGNFSNRINGFERTSPVYFMPFMNVPDCFKKYSDEIKKFEYVYAYFDEISDPRAKECSYFSSASDLYSFINRNAFADFVYSAYILSDIGIPESSIDFTLDTHHIQVKCNNWPSGPTGISFVSIFEPDREMEAGDGIIYIHPDNDLNTLLAVRTHNCYAVFMLSGYESRDFNIDLVKDVDSPKTKFFDNVLESEPYSFYSLSFLTYEMPFNRNRYYQNDEVKISYYVSVNGAVKLSYIPTYVVENKEYKYFNESLVFTLPDNLPLLSDSFSSYYYQNKAQMKNQFAVNDYNRGVDLAQHFFLSGPNAVGQQAFRRGGWGAIAETVNQFAQMGDEMIDWSQSNKVIDMNQKAKLADMGAKPDVVKQTGSDVFYDLITCENRPYFNHYTIDEASYNSIAKFLERFGYQINLYDSLHTNDRVGWNYIKLNSFDWNPAYDIMVGQEENLRKIFSNGVTLLHNKSYLTSGHNYETILDE